MIHLCQAEQSSAQGARLVVRAGAQLRHERSSRSLEPGLTEEIEQIDAPVGLMPEGVADGVESMLCSTTEGGDGGSDPVWESELESLGPKYKKNALKVLVQTTLSRKNVLKQMEAVKSSIDVLGNPEISAMFDSFLQVVQGAGTQADAALKYVMWELGQAAQRVRGDYVQRLLNQVANDERVKTQQDVNALVGRIAVYLETRYNTNIMFTEIVYDEEYDDNKVRSTP